MDGAIVLIGMMGSGKTTLGRLAAERLGREFADADALVEAEAGMPAAEIFRLRGEAEFRRLERGILERLIAAGGGRIVAAGGGAFCQPALRERILADAVAVYLRVPEEELLRRLEGDGVRTRPMLFAPDWRERFRELAAKREPLYAAAPIRVDLGGKTTEECVELLTRTLQGKTACSP